MRLANEAPAPNETNTAGSAQQISVEVDVNKDKKLAAPSRILELQHFNTAQVQAIVEHASRNSLLVDRIT